MTYQTAFPEFAPETMPAIPASWSDMSWRNDACPFFLITDSLGVWVDFADPQASDLGPDRAGRFTLVPMVDGQHPDDPGQDFLITDDWEAVLADVMARGAPA